MDIKTTLLIKVWQSRLKLMDWEIKHIPILPEQVMYDDDVPEKDRYFIGISKTCQTKEAIIFHDRPLVEEDIVHELTHLKHPKWSEDKVNSFQDFIIEYYEEIYGTRSKKR